VELSRRGVNITAFGPNPDGDGIVLRLWEMAGQSGKCRVRLPFGTNGLDVKYAKPVDLRGSAKEPGIPIKNGAFQAVLKPFAPASYILGR
jgi:alpha-mannosidase